VRIILGKYFLLASSALFLKVQSPGFSVVLMESANVQVPVPLSRCSVFGGGALGVAFLMGPYPVL
jgi:hypothetical protein